jgi:hypothetical protein
MQLGIVCGSSVEVGEEKPAFIVYAPLSMMRVHPGGGGPYDLVRRCVGAMVVERALVYPIYGYCKIVELLIKEIPDFENRVAK